MDPSCRIQRDRGLQVGFHVDWNCVIYFILLRRITRTTFVQTKTVYWVKTAALEPVVIIQVQYYTFGMWHSLSSALCWRFRYFYLCFFFGVIARQLNNSSLHSYWPLVCWLESQDCNQLFFFWIACARIRCRPGFDCKRRHSRRDSSYSSFRLS